MKLAIQRVPVRRLATNHTFQKSMHRMNATAICERLEDTSSLKSMRNFLQSNLSESGHLLKRDHLVLGEFAECFHKITAEVHPSLSHIALDDRLHTSKNLGFFTFNEPMSVVSCESLTSAANYSIVVFRLLKGAIIPLHDHPGMEVFSKILFGKLRVMGYDWVEEKTDENPISVPSTSSRFARKTFDEVVTSSTTEPFPLVGPVHRNLHCFEAVDDCAVFEVQFPPYSETKERSCTYYKAEASSDAENADSRLYRMNPLEHPPSFMCIPHDPMVYLN
eukprot:238012_1